MVAAAREYIDRIDRMGGALKAIEQGFQQREVQESSYRYQQEVESGKRVIVGLNKFEGDWQEITGLLRVDPAEEKKQVEHLTAVKRERNAESVASALAALKAAAAGDANTVPCFIDCVEAYATLGEICDTLRDVFGVQKEFLIF